MMHVLEIRRNGVKWAIIGAPNASMFSVDISTSIGDSNFTLDVRGMNDLPSERQSHTTWLECEPLMDGDEIELIFTASDSATPCKTEVATDSPSYLAEQTEYAAELERKPLAACQLEAKSPNATIQLAISDHDKIIATLESGREFLTCNFHWDRWRPERCRVSLSSFSQEEALARTGRKEWFKGVLSLSEACTVRVSA